MAQPELLPFPDASRIGARNRGGMTWQSGSASPASPAGWVTCCSRRCAPPAPNPRAASAARVQARRRRTAWRCCPTSRRLPPRPDVVVDFTNAATARPYAAAIADAGKAWVLGTSGLSEADEAAVAIAAERVPVVYASNFSAGVNLVLALAERMGAALPADTYDAEIMEMHHRQKVDAPSGTAIGMGRAVAKGRGVDVLRGNGERPSRPHRRPQDRRDRLRGTAWRPGGRRAYADIRRSDRAHRADPPRLRSPGVRQRRRSRGAVGEGAAASSILHDGRAGDALSDGIARLAARYPQVWHVIEADGAGPWLTHTGLLPAADLRCGGANRDSFDCVDLGGGRRAVLRPQQMPDHRLLPTLDGNFAGQPEQWRRHVDRHVFFWTDSAPPRRLRAGVRAAAPDGGCGAGRAHRRYSHPARTAFHDRLLRHDQHRIDRPRRCAGCDVTRTRCGRRRSTRGGAVAELAIRGKVDPLLVARQHASVPAPRRHASQRRTALSDAVNP